MNLGNAWKLLMGEDLNVADSLDVDEDHMKDVIEGHYQKLKAIEELLKFPTQMKWWIHLGSGISGFVMEKISLTKSKNFSYMRAGIYYMATFAFLESVMMYHGMSELGVVISNAIEESRDQIVELTEKFG